MVPRHRHAQQLRFRVCARRHPRSRRLAEVLSFFRCNPWRMAWVVDVAAVMAVLVGWTLLSPAVWVVRPITVVMVWAMLVMQAE